nr:crosslink repair DNA glycosylase YcaQ family protein [Jannaschia sp. Os4]
MRLLQIDSVNVVARAHLLTLHARLGPFDPADLHRAAYGGRRRRLFEYWGHECSYAPVEDWPLWQWRMKDARQGIGLYGNLARFGRERRDLIDATLARIEAEGAVSSGDLGGRGEGGWWGWSETKQAVEWLFWAGRLTTATRGGTFERVYDLPERVLPRAALDAPVPDRAEAQARLMDHALRAQGVATEGDLRDFLRLRPGDSRAALSRLAEEGVAVPVRITGWPEAWMHRDARIPRTVETTRLLAPFDPLVWTRDRAERLFGMRVKLEIYTPAEQRRHGYYVLPFLLGDALVARVDLKADRKAGVLRVLATHGEDHAPDHACAALGDALRGMAGWLGLERIEVAPKGDLAARLAGACA